MTEKFDKKIDAVDGEEIVLPKPPGTLQIICCDCGLTHDVEIRTRGFHFFGITFNRNQDVTNEQRNTERKKFLALPLEKRRELLEEQANRPEIISYYKQLDL